MQKKLDYDCVAQGVASRLAARARCAECGKTMDAGAFDPEDQPARHPDRAGRALCLGCWQESNSLCAGCEMPFPHGELREDPRRPADDIFPLGDFYCRECLAERWRRVMPENKRSPELHRRSSNPILEEALRHEKAIDAILDEPAEWWTGSFAEDPNKPPHKVLKSLDEGPSGPLWDIPPPCAYCCRPAGADGLCGECRYEHGE